LHTPSGVLELGTGLEEASSHKAQAKERRIVKIHHKVAKSLSALDAILWVLWLAPAMDRLFSDAPDKRRKFFDHLIGGLLPKHKILCARYRTLLKERMQVLFLRSSDKAWIGSIEKRLAQIGAQISTARQHFLDKLAPVLRMTPPPFPYPEIRLRETYQPLQGSVEDTLCTAFEESRAQDAQTGTTAFGPHRTEWEVQFVKKNLPSSACSTGEQKALLLSIILATARLYKEHHKSVPLLLLDDFSAHLDAHKQSVLWEALKDLGMQTWFTSVDLPNFPSTSSNLQHFAVEHGICTSVPF
jgi:DNA replication and repair protein RecF